MLTAPARSAYENDEVISVPDVRASLAFLVSSFEQLQPRLCPGGLPAA